MKLHERITDFAARAADETGRRTLPGNCGFLDQDTILCRSRETGDSRYPYSTDGFTLWAHASGYLSVNESTFYVILPQSSGREPFAVFFGGVKGADGRYRPVSLLPVTRLPDETDCKRYTVYTPSAAYYAAETPEVNFGLRVLVRPGREVCYSLTAVNKSGKPQEIYLSQMLSCLLKHDPFETVETNWFRSCKKTPLGYLFESVEDLSRTEHLTHYGVLRRRAPDGATVETTCARSIFTGGTNNPVILSEALRCGKFSRQKDSCKFTDTPVAGDIVRCVLEPGGSATADYVLTVADNAAAKDAVCRPIEPGELDAYVDGQERQDRAKFAAENMLKMRLCGMKDGRLDAQTFDCFLRSVMRQVEFAALAKNSGVSLLGIRDVFQQIEAALMWNAPACRAKIIEALDFIGADGRPPRQYSIPPSPGALPRLDLRAFIDQGVWIINTVYTYLSFTGDDSILQEECGYYDFLPGGEVRRSCCRDTVLSHLIRIADFLISNLDDDTDCLHVLYGDWNDALDGLGVSSDSSREFGTGVSVMASLQLYQNLTEMKEITGRALGDKALAERYEGVRSRLLGGLKRNAVATDRSGRKKILHGWGDHRAYEVGSFCDSDGKERDGLTSNAFWVISGLYRDGATREEIADTVSMILGCYGHLDSKYGLKTFEPYFPKDMKGVGRIVNLPVGTAENAATYIHATLFGIWSLFLMGEGEKAWEQLYKVLPLTHERLSTTPFVMSNSYSYNEEFGMDGESMSDWFTGSANVLIKVMVRCVFGVEARLDRVVLAPAAYLPAESSEISIRVRGALLHIVRRKTGGPRRFIVGGVERPAVEDEITGLRRLEIPCEELTGELEIEITD